MFQKMDNLNFTYLVTYDGDGSAINRLVTVRRKSELLAKAESMFGLSGETKQALEYYHDEYGMYIRPMSPDELPDRGKIRLIRSSSPPDATTVITFEPTYDGSSAAEPILVPSVGPSSP